MNTITLTKKEYKELFEIKKRLDSLLDLIPRVERKEKFTDKAFGTLKDNFGKKPSVFYVSKMRKAWRE